jgi:hypothetical protein
MLNSIQMSYARFLGSLLLCSATIAFSCSTASADEHPSQALPPGVVQKGTLANSNLIRDTKLFAAAKLGSMGYHITPTQPFTAYVVSMPTGAAGARAWAERWVFAIDGKEVPITIDFKADGKGSADFSIRNDP